MQGLHAIPRATLKLCGPVPQEISAYITQAEYTVVCSEVQQSDSEATLLSCGVEFGVCIISGLFCVFCAHPWIEEMIANGNLPRCALLVIPTYHHALFGYFLSADGFKR